MRRALAIAAAILVFALPAPPARAASDVEALGLPTTGAVHLPMVESLEPIAEAYWSLRGITLPTPVEVFVIPDTPSGAAFGEQPGTRVWLTEELLAKKGVVWRLILCETYLHERGHNAGLAHGSGDPIMDPDFWDEMTHPVPKCLKWAESGYRAALTETG